MSAQATSRFDTLTPEADLPEGSVELEKTGLLFRNAGIAQGVSVLNSTVLLFIFGGLTPPWWALVWWLTAVVLAAIRYRLARMYLASQASAVTAPGWRRRALAGVVLAGLLWGGGGMAMMIADPEGTRLFAALVMAGMVAGAVPALSSVPVAFRIYAAAVTLPIIVTALCDAHGPRDWMLAVTATLYLLALLRSASFFHDSLERSIRLALHMQRMAEQLDTARQGAEAASSAKSQFLAAISHELRTPLNGVIGMTTLMLDNELSPAQRQRAEIINTSATSLLTILNDILDFSKIEAGRLGLERVPFDLRSLLEEIAKLSAFRANAKNLEFQSVVADDVPAWVAGDPTRIRQILNNFVGNALKFTVTGKIVLRVESLDCNGDGPMLRLAVSDTGIGIPRETQDKLFVPFTQADSSTTRRYGGTGLGLAIAKQLAELMGGRIGMESVEREGSTFWVALPLAPATPPPVLPQPALAGGDASGSDIAGGKYAVRLLLVEDDVTNRMVASGILRRLGYQDVQMAMNGQEALERAAAEAFDVILMDCHMPIMDGYQATTALRAAGCTTPIVAMTASAMRGDREKCLAAGMNDYITKPISKQELLVVLTRWAGPHRRESGA